MASPSVPPSPKVRVDAADADLGGSAVTGAMLRGTGLVTFSPFTAGATGSVGIVPYDPSVTLGALGGFTFGARERDPRRRPIVRLDALGEVGLDYFHVTQLGLFEEPHAHADEVRRSGNAVVPYLGVRFGVAFRLGRRERSTTLLGFWIGGHYDLIRPTVSYADADCGPDYSSSCTARPESTRVGGGGVEFGIRLGFESSGKGR